MSKFCLNIVVPEKTMQMFHPVLEGANPSLREGDAYDEANHHVDTLGSVVMRSLISALPKGTSIANIKIECEAR